MLRHMQKAEEQIEAIHNFFGLSYAAYLVLPRSVLQSMPDEWQTRFVKMLNEVGYAIDWNCPDYWVRAKDDEGRFVKDEYRDYDRGRRRIKLKNKS